LSKFFKVSIDDTRSFFGGYKMIKILLFLLLFLLNFSFAQNFLKVGYGTHGYRLGLDLKVNSNLISYISLFMENEYEDGDISATGTTIVNRVTVNGTASNIKYSYALNNIYLNLGLTFSTQLENFYITPFVKIRRTYFRIENATFRFTDSTWKIGGGINFAYVAYITSIFAIVPQVYIYYVPRTAYYFENKKLAETGKSTIQIGLALDLNMAFNDF